MKPLAHMAPFFSRFPEVAARETRTIKLLAPHAGLPAGEYGFLELYCNEPTCDCRRVLFQVCCPDTPNQVLATINYGWESEDFYAQWLHGDRESARELVSASLDPLNPHNPNCLRHCWRSFAILSCRIGRISPGSVAIIENSSARSADHRQGCPTGHLTEIRFD
ncbi:MAG: hypothetical protein ACLQVW_01960 [Limisphaerales bacterium]